MKKITTSLAVAAAIALSACAASASSEPADGVASLDSVPRSEASPTAASPDEQPAEEDIEQAFADYEKCVDDLGLGDLLPSDEGDGVGTDADAEGGVVASGTFDAADFDEGAFERMQEECEPILNSVSGAFELSPEEEAAQKDAELEFARCMRAEGIDWPDPGTGEDNGTIIFEEGDDLDPAALDEAFETCDKVFEESYEDAAQAEAN